MEHTVSISTDRLASKLDPDKADTIGNIKLVDGFRASGTSIQNAFVQLQQRIAKACAGPRQGRRADVPCRHGASGGARGL